MVYLHREHKAKDALSVNICQGTHQPREITNCIKTAQTKD